MTDHLRNTPVSRRDLIRLSGGTAAAVGLGALATPASAGTRGTGAPGGAASGATTDGTGSASLSPGADIRPRSSGADLLIRDGSPHWWLSPDIWVVPGPDPNGTPGTPAAGDTAYVWARVQNTGQKDVFGAELRFYWGNPSVQMFYSTLNLIGTAYADIKAGESQDVLCLVPWRVVTVNNGHECLVVVASTPDDPPLPDAVDPVSYPNVAQRNLTLASSSSKEDFKLTVTVSAPRRESKRVRIGAQIGGELSREALRTLGLADGRPVEKPVVEVGFAEKPITNPKDGVGEPWLELEVPAGRSVPVYLTIRGGADLPAGAYQLVEVIETQKEQTLGGISFAVVGEGRR